MSAATIQIPGPEPLQPAFTPGIYLTDGTRLYRVISPGRSLFPSAELEDCLTLEVERYDSDELRVMGLQRVELRDPPASPAARLGRLSRFGRP